MTSRISLLIYWYDYYKAAHDKEPEKVKFVSRSELKKLGEERPDWLFARFNMKDKKMILEPEPYASGLICSVWDSILHVPINKLEGEETYTMDIKDVRFADKSVDSVVLE